MQELRLQNHTSKTNVIFHAQSSYISSRTQSLIIKGTGMAGIKLPKREAEDSFCIQTHNQCCTRRLQDTSRKQHQVTCEINPTLHKALR